MLLSGDGDDVAEFGQGHGRLDPFALSLSKGFDKLSPNGIGVVARWLNIVVDGVIGAPNEATRVCQRPARSASHEVSPLDTPSIRA